MLRILLDQPGPRMPLDDDERLVSSDLLEVECSRALERARLLRQHDDAQAANKREELRRLLARTHLVAPSADVFERASQPFGVIVRALDAIHVATAEDVAENAKGTSLEFWTHDSRQAIAARPWVGRARPCADRLANASPAASEDRADAGLHVDLTEEFASRRRADQFAGGTGV